MGNQELLKYCSVCNKHTPHQNIATVYATACLKCGAHTSELMRAQAETATPATLVAPDGAPALIVENTPIEITYFVAEGEYAGYYRHDKRTGKNEISAVSL